MRKPLTMALMVVGFGGILGVGLAVGSIGSSNGSSSPAASTSESTTEHATSTTEQAMRMSNLYIAAIDAKAERPAPKGTSNTAGGAFALWLTHKGTKYTASWKLIFGGLTGGATAAHIHKGRPGTAGAVLVPLCGPCKSGQTGSASISAATLKAMQTGAAYVNVHTAKNPGGEIRGQIK